MIKFKTLAIYLINIIILLSYTMAAAAPPDTMKGNTLQNKIEFAEDFELPPKIKDKIISDFLRSFEPVFKNNKSLKIESVIMMEKFDMPGWIYSKMSIIEKQKQVDTFQVLTNGKYMIPVPESVLEVQTGKNVLAINDVQIFNKNEIPPATNNIIYGKPDAKNQITIFSDLWCGHCHKLKRDINEWIKETTPHDVVIYQRYSPLGPKNLFVTHLYDVVRRLEMNSELKSNIFKYLLNEETLELPQKDILMTLHSMVKNDKSLSMQLRKHLENDHNVEQDVLLANNIGIQGVPYILVNGEGIKGYNQRALFDRLEKLNNVNKGE